MVLSTLLLFLSATYFALDLPDQLSRALVAGEVEEEDDSVGDPVDDGEGAVETEVLLELREGPDDVAGEDEGQDDEQGG